MSWLWWKMIHLWVSAVFLFLIVWKFSQLHVPQICSSYYTHHLCCLSRNRHPNLYTMMMLSIYYLVRYSSIFVINFCMFFCNWMNISFSTHPWWCQFQYYQQLPMAIQSHSWKHNGHPKQSVRNCGNLMPIHSHPSETTRVMKVL